MPTVPISAPIINNPNGPNAPAEPGQSQIPPLHDICSDTWPTLTYAPADARDEWSSIFVETALFFVSAPSVATFTLLYFCCKTLMATVRHGEKARMEAVIRTFGSHFTLWQAGRFGELWERVKHDNARRSTTQEKRDNDQLQREAQRVARGYSLALLRNYAPAASPPSTQKRCRRCSSSSPPVNCLSTPPSSKPQRSNSSLQR